MNVNEQWVGRQEKDESSRREYEYERLMVWVLDEIYGAMDRNGVSQADVARTLETTRANISRAFSGGRNLSLRTVSDLAWASGVRLCVKAQPLRKGAFISSPVIKVEQHRPVILDSAGGRALERMPCADLMAA